VAPAYTTIAHFNQAEWTLACDVPSSTVNFVPHSSVAVCSEAEISLKLILGRLPKFWDDFIKFGTFPNFFSKFQNNFTFIDIGYGIHIQTMVGESYYSLITPASLVGPRMGKLSSSKVLKTRWLEQEVIWADSVWWVHRGPHTCRTQEAGKEELEAYILTAFQGKSFWSFSMQKGYRRTTTIVSCTNEKLLSTR
jgi:hypothetical protein